MENRARGAPLPDDLAAALPLAEAKKPIVVGRAGSGAEVNLSGIVGWDITLAALNEAMKSVASDAPLTVRINSGGGDVFEGFAVYNRLARHEGPIRVEIEALAASMGSLIAMAGDEIVMPQNSFLMVHNPWGMAIGEADDMRKHADLLDRLKEPMVATYAARSGKEAEDVRALMADETWMSADEAVEAGFATSVTEPRVVASCADLSKFRLAPPSLLAGSTAPPVLAVSKTTSTDVPHKETVMSVETPANAAPPAEPVVTAAVPPARVAATLAEIEGIAARGKLGPDFVVAQLKKGATVTEATDAVIDAMASKIDRPAASIQLVADHASHHAMIDAMGTALAIRIMPSGNFGSADGKHREYMGLTPGQMMVELAAARGEAATPRHQQKIIANAMHTTSDFPLLLENVGNKVLLAGYQAAAPTYKTIFAQKSFNDFREHKFYTAGDFPALLELPEGGAIEQGTMSEKREALTPKTYARSMTLSRQMLVNDNFGAFDDWTSMIGRRIADQENALAYAVVNTASGAGPTLQEGNAAVFTTTRGNRSSGGGAIDNTSLDAAYAGVMGVTSLDGIKLNVQPKYLLTGVAYRAAALRAIAPLQPTAASNIQLYGTLTPVMDANIPGNRWYLLPDPAAAPIFVYGYVNGASAPQIRVHPYIPGRDGIMVEVIHDFGVGAIDWRGGWFNQGA